MTKKENQENLLKKYLTTEVKYIIWIVAFVRGIAVPYFWIKQDIALIKENHMTHMEAFDKELAQQNAIQTKQQDMLIKLMEKVAALK